LLPSRNSHWVHVGRSKNRSIPDPLCNIIGGSQDALKVSATEPPSIPYDYTDETEVAITYH
jgi:hypothetical protein